MPEKTNAGPESAKALLQGMVDGLFARRILHYSHDDENPSAAAVVRSCTEGGSSIIIWQAGLAIARQRRPYPGISTRLQRSEKPNLNERGAWEEKLVQDQKAPKHCCKARLTACLPDIFQR